jgi:predicted HAD superfamily Cof-like phosphohydrolase
MKPLKIKLQEMLEKDLNKDEQHKLTMDLFEHHSYTKESAFIAGYRDAVSEILKFYQPTPVREFHSAFGHPVNDTPQIPPLASRILSVKLVIEEALEYAEASAVDVFVVADDVDGVEIMLNLCERDELIFEESTRLKPDINEAADALGDLRVVIDGGNLRWGLPQEEILYEVHRSNMSKLGEDGKPIYREDGKILKGPNFTPPDIKGILLSCNCKKD